MRILLNITFIYTICFASTAHARPCEKMLAAYSGAKQMGQRYAAFLKKDFWPDVVATRGRRLLTKKSPDGSPRGRQCFYSRQEPSAELGPVRGFLRACNPVDTLYWLFNDRERTHVLQPVRGSIRYLLAEPLGLATERLFGRREKFVWPIEAPVLFAAAILPWIVGFEIADTLTPIAIDLEVREKIDRDLPRYLHAIRSDYQFHEIRRRFESGKLTKEQAATEVRAMLEYLNIYRLSQRARLLTPEPSDENMLALLKIPIFKPLIPLVLNGLRANPALEIPPEKVGPVPDVVLYAMMVGIDELYIKYAVIQEFVESTYVGESGAISLTPAARALKDDPFTQKLLDLEKSRKITLEQVQYALGESAFWERRLADYKLLGAKLKRPEGGYADLSDFQNSILNGF